MKKTTSCHRIGFIILIIYSLILTAYAKPALASSALTPGSKLAATTTKVQKITLKMVVAWEKGFPLFWNPAERFARLVSEKSKGELEIKLLGGPEIVAVDSMLDSLRGGIIDIASAHNSYYSGIVPDSMLIDIPFNWSPEENLKAFYAALDAMNEVYIQKTSTRVLGTTSWTYHYLFTSRKPVASSADMKGLRLRVPGGIYGVGTTLLGGTPVKIPVAEVLTALERGIIDGAQRATQAVNHYHEDEFLKYRTDFRFAATIGYNWISAKVWDGLSDQLKKSLIDASKELDIWALDYGPKSETEAKTALEKRGVTFIPVAIDDQQRWKEMIWPAAVDKVIKSAPASAPKIWAAIEPFSHFQYKP